MINCHNILVIYIYKMCDMEWKTMCDMELKKKKMCAVKNNEDRFFVLLLCIQYKYKQKIRYTWMKILLYETNLSKSLNLVYKLNNYVNFKIMLR